MPRPVRAYGCRFLCGQKIVLSKRAMVAHEGICIKNPERRACPTCQYNYTETAEFSYQPRRNYECFIGELALDVTLVFNCEFWKGAAKLEMGG